MAKKSWFTVKSMGEKTKSLDVTIHDEIGLWGVTAKDFIEAINSEPVDQINVSIHSPGGSLFDGLAMYNALASHSATVHTHVTGLAASAASIVLMAGDEITMPEDAWVMIHNAWMLAVGDADELRDMADLMDQWTESIVNIYQKQTDIDRADLVEMMSEETWMNGTDALEKGFVDSVTDAVKVAALAPDFAKHFKDLPANLAGQKTVSEIVNDIETPRDFENALRDAGCSQKLATALASKTKDAFPGEPDGAEIVAHIDQAFAEVKLSALI